MEEEKKTDERQDAPTKEEKKKIKDRIKRDRAEFKKNAKKFGSEFKKFITKGNIIDLAIAVMIGTAFNTVVNGLVSYIITPVLGLFFGGINMDDWKIVLRDATETRAEISILYGSFIQVIINFLTVALCLFIGLKIVTRVRNKINEKEIAQKKIAEENKKVEDKAKEENAKIEMQRKAEVENRYYENVESQRIILEKILENLENGNARK